MSSRPRVQAAQLNRGALGSFSPSVRPRVQLLVLVLGACHASQPAGDRTVQVMPPGPPTQDTTPRATDSVIALAPSPAVSDTGVAAWLPDSVLYPSEQGIPQREILILHNGHRVETPLHGVRFLGFLPSPGRPPYLVLEGRPCDRECDEFNLELDILSPTNPRDATGYDAPGAGWAFDPSDTTPVSANRVFLGRCADGSDEIVVWFARHRAANGQWEKVTHRVEVVGDSLHVTERPTSADALAETLRTVQRGLCRELD